MTTDHPHTIDPQHPWLVVGAGGHARTVLDCLHTREYPVAGIIDLTFHDQDERIMGSPVLGGLELLDGQFTPAMVYLALAVGDNALRRELFLRLAAQGYRMPPLVHQSVVVSPFCRLGEGCLVAPGCLLNAGVVIGDNTIVNTGAIIDHETVVGPHSHLAPGVKIAGRVNIGSECLIGIGTRIIDKINIGDRANIGAGSVVVRHIPADCTAVGVPCRVIK